MKTTISYRDVEQKVIRIVVDHTPTATIDTVNMETDLENDLHNDENVIDDILEDCEAAFDILIEYAGVNVTVHGIVAHICAELGIAVPPPLRKKVRKTLENQARDNRKPSVENLVRDVEASPGYHTAYWHKAVWAYIRTRNPEVLEWQAVKETALKEGLLRQDAIGKLWPATGPFPKPWDYTRMFLNGLILGGWPRIAIWLFGFLFMFYATAEGGRQLVEQLGLLGHVCRGAGVVMTLLMAGGFWNSLVNRR